MGLGGNCTGASRFGAGTSVATGAVEMAIEVRWACSSNFEALPGVFRSWWNCAGVTA